MKQIVLMIAVNSLLGACNVNINGEANVDTGGNTAPSHRDDLLTGPCGTWEIAGEWEGVTFSGRCQMEVDAGMVAFDNLEKEEVTLDSSLIITVPKPGYYDDDFYTTQLLLVKSVGTNPLTRSFESCYVTVISERLYVECGFYSFEANRKVQE